MPSIEIDDVERKRTLTRRLERLLESGAAVPLKELLGRVTPAWSGAEVASAPPEESTPAEIYRSACRGVVVVGKLYRCRRCQKRHTSIASGFVIARSGLIVTNHHVAVDPDKETLGIMTFDGSVYPATSVLRADRRSDLAVVEVPAQNLVPLPVGEEPPVGAPIYVLSHPAGRLYTFSAGMVSRYLCNDDSRSDDEHDGRGEDSPPASRPLRLMTVTADFGRGSSGAPVLDAHGAVVGVARKTRSVYHHPDDDSPRRLQMVLKHCAPARALRELGLEPKGASGQIDARSGP